MAIEQGLAIFKAGSEQVFAVFQNKDILVYEVAQLFFPFQGSLLLTGCVDPFGTEICLNKILYLHGKKSLISAKVGLGTESSQKKKRIEIERTEEKKKKIFYMFIPPVWLHFQNADET